MSSSDKTTLGVHRNLHEALVSAREAQHLLNDGDAKPDLDDLAQLSKLVAELAETATAINAQMAERARAR